MFMPPHPDYIQIETTIACNAECPFCPHHLLTRRPKRMLDEVWMKIVDETRALGITYRPFMVNEPLADSRLCDIMRYIRKDPTAKIELNTNGELMKEVLAREIIDIGIDGIRFSIDGLSRETFAKSRVGVDFDLTVERTLAFIALAKTRSCADRIEVRMIGTVDNAHEHRDYVDFWTNAGARAVITEMYHWPWDPGVEPVQLPCKKVLREMFFFVNGKATLCCWDTHERGVIGDVTREHVLEIWKGEVNRRYRALLEQGRRRDILLCSKCDAYKNHRFEGFPQPAASQS